MPQHPSVMSILAAAAALSVGAAATQAAIVQFEAESGSLGSDFSVANNGDVLDPANGPNLEVAGALGGQVIYDNNGGGSGAANVVTYSVNFAEAGEYDLYVRVYSAPSGSHDSFFAGAGFGVRNATDFGADAEWHEMNGWGAWNTGAFPGLQTVDGLAWNGTLPDLTPVWVNLTANWDENITTNVVDIGTYTTAGGVETFQIAGRESFMLIDALAFVSTSDRDSVVVDLDGNLAIPEPASLALLGVGGALLAARRRGA